MKLNLGEIVLIVGAIWVLISVFVAVYMMKANIDSAFPYYIFAMCSILLYPVVAVIGMNIMDKPLTLE